MTPRPHITDHALLRYLERRLGIDIYAHRRDMEKAVERDAVFFGPFAPHALNNGGGIDERAVHVE